MKNVYLGKEKVIFCLTFPFVHAIVLWYVKKTKQSSTLTSAHRMRLGFILHKNTGLSLCVSGYNWSVDFVRTFFHGKVPESYELG